MGAGVGAGVGVGVGVGCGRRVERRRGVGQDSGAAARLAYGASTLEIRALAGFGQDAVAPVGVKALEAGDQVFEMVP